MARTRTHQTHTPNARARIDHKPRAWVDPETRIATPLATIGHKAKKEV